MIDSGGFRIKRESQPPTVWTAKSTLIAMAILSITILGCCALGIVGVNVWLPN